MKPHIIEIAEEMEEIECRFNSGFWMPRIPCRICAQTTAFLFIYFFGCFFFFLTQKHPYIKGISSTKMEISTNSLSTYASYSSTVDHSEVSQRESTQLEGHLQEPNRRKAN